MYLFCAEVTLDYCRNVSPKQEMLAHRVSELGILGWLCWVVMSHGFSQEWGRSVLKAQNGPDGPHRFLLLCLLVGFIHFSPAVQAYYLVWSSPRHWVVIQRKWPKKEKKKERKDRSLLESTLGSITSTLLTDPVGHKGEPSHEVGQNFISYHSLARGFLQGGHLRNWLLPLWLKIGLTQLMSRVAEGVARQFTAFIVKYISFSKGIWDG